MNPIELIALQISLEYDLDAQGLLVARPGSSEQGLYNVYRHAGGYVPYYSHLLPAALRQQLAGLGPALAFENPAVIRQAITTGYATCQGGEQVFWSGYFVRRPGRADFPTPSACGDDFVIRVGGREVRRALSVRSNPGCAEAYAETHPDHRRRLWAAGGSSLGKPYLGPGTVASTAISAQPGFGCLAHSLGRHGMPM
jgi:hypothetical protein